MKNFIKRLIVAIMLIVTLPMVFAGCTEAKIPEGNNDSLPSEKEDIITGEYIFKNNTSEYKVVIPTKATNNEQIAASELVFFLKKATQYNFELISDDSAFIDENNRYISVGETSILKDINLKIDKQELTDDGYVIKTKFNSIYIIGGSDTGTVNGVYGLLEKLVNYEALATDEYYFEETNEIPLYDLNEKSIPDFKYRMPGHFSVGFNSEFSRRLRVHHYRKNWGANLSSHTNFKMLPPDVYSEKHPDWYSVDGNGLQDNKQLCLSRCVGDLTKNAEMGTMRYEYVANLKAKVESSPEAHNYMLGQQDFPTCCQCEECKKNYAKYGGPSGVQVRFVNAVAREMNEWLKEKYPERNDVTFVVFAYQETFDAPVVSENGKIKPVDDSVKFEDNLGVMIAPIDMAYNYSIKDEVNIKYGKAFEEWSVLTNKIYVWNYSYYADNFFAFFDNSQSLEANYRYYKEHNVVSLFDEAGTDMGDRPVMNELQIYLQSKLMWDTSLDMKELTENFIRRYYGEAAPYISEYYENLIVRYRIYEDEYLERTNGKTKWELKILKCFQYDGEDICRPEFWPRDFMKKQKEILDEAVVRVEKIEDPVRREKLLLRVKKQRLTPMYILLDFYIANMDDLDANKMIDEFEKDVSNYSIMRWKEIYNGTAWMADKIMEWRSNLNL